MSKKLIYDHLAVSAIFQQKTINMLKNHKGLVQAKNANIISTNQGDKVLLSSSKNLVGHDINSKEIRLKNLTNKEINIEAIIDQAIQYKSNTIPLLRKRLIQIKERRNKKGMLLLSSKKGGFNTFFLGSKAFYPRSQSVTLFKKIYENYLKCTDKQKLISATKAFSNTQMSTQTTPVIRVPFKNAKFTLYPIAKTINFAKRARRYNKNNLINFVFATIKNKKTYEINKEENPKKTSTNKYLSKTSNSIKKLTRE